MRIVNLARWIGAIVAFPMCFAVAPGAERSPAGGDPASATAGVVAGCSAPLWQELHVTSRRPPKLSRLIAVTMEIILRAVSFSFLSSFSFARST